MNIVHGYNYIKKIGRGSFADVWQVRRVSDNKIFALKEIFMRPCDEKHSKQVQNEIMHMKIMKHRGVVAYVDSFMFRNQMYIVLEFCEGGDLQTFIQHTRIAKGRICEHTIWKIFSDIVHGLQYIHNSGVLHRDMKPENVLLDGDQNAKISDFGLSRVIPTTCAARTICGTPMYMSPEVCQSNEYGTKNDIWGLGCILYELATLDPPFYHEDRSVLVDRIVKSKPTLFISSCYSIEICMMVARILVKDPANRPSLQMISSCFAWDGTDIVVKRGLLFARTLDYKYIRYNENDLQNLSRRKSACGYINIQLTPHVTCDDAVLKVRCLIGDDGMLRLFTGVEHTIESMCIHLKYINVHTHPDADNRHMFVMVVPKPNLPSPSLFCFVATAPIRDEWVGLFVMYGVTVKHLPMLSNEINRVETRKLEKTKSLECMPTKKLLL